MSFRHIYQQTQLPFKKILVITFLGSVSILLLLTLFEIYYCNYLSNNSDKIVSTKTQETIEYIKTRFNLFQQNTLQTLHATEMRTGLDKKLSQYPKLSRKEFFDILLSDKNDEVIFELLDRNKNTIAWTDNYGPLIDTLILRDVPDSYIIPKAFFTYLIVSLPIKSNNDIVGYIVGKRLFNVQYPISNRFINSNYFNYAFIAQLQKDFQVDFILKNNLNLDNENCKVKLNSISNGLLGYIVLQQPSIGEIIVSFKNKIFFMKIIFTFIGMISIVFVMWKWYTVNYSWFKGSLLILFIWLFRFILLWLNLPQRLVQIDYFEPQYYASQFGFGIAKSLGDLCISSIFLLASILIFIKTIFHFVNKYYDKIVNLQFNKIIVAILIIIVLLTLLTMTRVLIAVTKSAVHDSNLDYSNLTEVFPSLDLGIMYVSLLLVIVSVMIFSVTLILILKILVDKLTKARISNNNSWLITIFFLLGGSILYGLFYKNTLLSQETRILILLLPVILSYWVYVTFQKSKSLSVGKLSILILAISILIMLPFLKSSVRDSEHSFIEILACKLSKPIDNWLNFLVNEALDNAISETNQNVLINGDETDISNLAFSTWAASTLSKEGNNCSITFFNSRNEVINRLQIGRFLFKSQMNENLVSSKKRMIITEERVNNGLNMLFYIGFSPIFIKDSTIIGYVLVELSGSKQDFLKGDLPFILRNYASQKPEMSLKHVFLSEYIDGELVSSTNEVIPRVQRLPELSMSQNSSTDGKWLFEKIEDINYESYYFRDQGQSNSNIWYSLSFESESFGRALYWYLKGIMFFLIVFGLIFVLVILFYNFKHKQFHVSFTHKLFIAFVLVSFVPIFILAHYNKQYAVKRANDTATEELSNKSKIIAQELQHKYNLNIPVSFDLLSNDKCLKIADETNTDFDVYFLSTVDATTKPEMYQAGFVNYKMSATAYLNVILKQKEFYTEEQTIGNYSYLVGYRALFADDGTVIGAVSVPTLYTEYEIDEELADRNVFLFGAYAFALIISILLSLFITQRFASPIKALKNAIHQISMGNLEIKLKRSRNDELGDLEEAFGQMAENLKKTQEAMIKAQREAAWKEMAKQIAHEIKNPLTPIKLSIQHLHQAYQDGVKNFNEIFHQVTKTVLDQIEILNNIASEFSHFARMPAKKIETLDVHQILNDVITMFREYQNINFIIKFDADRSIVNSDRQELTRSFINLIQNSIQAMNGNGNIYIQTRSIGKNIEIIIRDTGPGIPEEIQSHLFEPNFSTKTDGMGLGLSIVKKCIDDLNGNITIESNPGKGTIVCINLPLQL